MDCYMHTVKAPYLLKTYASRLSTDQATARNNEYFKMAAKTANWIVTGRYNPDTSVLHDRLVATHEDKIFLNATGYNGSIYSPVSVSLDKSTNADFNKIKVCIVSIFKDGRFITLFPTFDVNLVTCIRNACKPNCFLLKQFGPQFTEEIQKLVMSVGVTSFSCLGLDGVLHKYDVEVADAGYVGNTLPQDYTAPFNHLSDISRDFNGKKRTPGEFVDNIERW